MSCKITLIGAGSVVFAKTLISDILQFPELSDSHICLMDIDPDRLKVAEIMMNRIVAKLGVKAKVSATSNQRTAIKGAKYVICTIQVGGYKPSTVRDFEIPKKYGLKQTIADTLGVGGVFRALRTIPVINGIAQDIADVGHPDCLFLNYTNPMAMNCWAVEEAVGIPHVGLCHSVFGTARMLASHANLPFKDVSYLVGGINHMAFFLKFQYKGQDAYPLLFKVLNNPSRQFEKVRYEMMRRTGYFVTESSEHQSEYIPYFIHHGKKIIDEFNIPIDEYIRRCESCIATWEKTEAELLGEGGEIDIREQSHEYGSYIIHSRETDTPRTVYGNVPNYGLIDNLTQGCNVEVPCLVDATGLNPVRIGTLPEQLAALCMTNVNVQRLTVDAALTHKREHIYHAVMMDPHASSTLTLDKIWAMCDELIEAHQKDGYLGEFEPVIKNTGRSYAGVGDKLIASMKTDGLRLDKAGSTFEITASVDNPGITDSKAALTLKSSSPAISLVGKTSLNVKVPAGKSVSKKFKAKVTEVVEEAVSLSLAGDSNILSINALLRKRTTIKRDSNGQHPITVQLSGFDAVTGTLAVDKNNLHLKLRVLDSDIKPIPQAPYKGSGLEIFFADENGDKLTNFFVVPDKKAGGKLLTAHLKPAQGAKLKLTRSLIDYVADITIPIEKLGINEDAFLFDIIAMLGALGDAHSGGRCSLSGHFDSATRTEHYLAINS